MGGIGFTSYCPHNCYKDFVFLKINCWKQKSFLNNLGPFPIPPQFPDSEMTEIVRNIKLKSAFGRKKNTVKYTH